ncbi:MAG: glycosyltransferase [Acidobacteria bacterium]|nr:glycosyltransferase [Acidobacteriota bacterium]
MVRTPQSAAPATKTEQTPITSTVVICTRNRPALLLACLTAIGGLSCRPTEILVVDNSDGDEATRKVALGNQARYAVEPLRGLSRARNCAIPLCNTDLIVFVDDDVMPEPNWLANLLRPFSDPDTAAATGSVITPDCPAGEGPKEPRSINNEHPHWMEIAAFGGLGFGANMAFRKKALPGGRFFNERLGRGGPFEIAEESYAFVWLLSRGNRVEYVPAAAVHHPPLTRTNIEREARNSFAYWLLLLADFPQQRTDLIRFLFRRLRGKPLEWQRDTQEPGEIVSSSRLTLLRAAMKGLWLFIRTPKSRELS